MQRIKFIFIFLILVSLSVHSGEFEKYAFDSKVGKTDILVVVKNGRVIYQKFQPNFSLHSPHITHSINKLYLSTFIANEVLKKSLNINAPIIKNPKNLYEAHLTLENLMQMNSGLRPIYDNESIEKINFGIIAPIDNFSITAFDYIRKKSLQMYNPGAQFNYSYLEYDLALVYLSEYYGHDNFEKKLNDFLSVDLKLENTLIKIPIYNNYLWDLNSSFLNQLILKINPKDLFKIPPPINIGKTSAKDVIKVASLYLNNGIFEGKRIFAPDWIAHSWSNNKRTFTISRRLDSYFSQFNVGYYWFLNQPFPDGVRPYPSLPSELVSIQGFKGQTLAIFPKEKIIYLRLANDEINNSSFNRQKHLELLYNEIIKNNK